MGLCSRTPRWRVAVRKRAVGVSPVSGCTCNQLQLYCDRNATTKASTIHNYTKLYKLPVKYTRQEDGDTDQLIINFFGRSFSSDTQTHNAPCQHPPAGTSTTPKVTLDCRRRPRDLGTFLRNWALFKTGM